VLIIAFVDFLAEAIAAAETVNLPVDRIVVLEGSTPTPAGFLGISDIVRLGKTSPAFVERRLQPGEAKTKLAFLSFSSGTTGTYIL
jgi:hypothetical protein